LMRINDERLRKSVSSDNHKVPQVILNFMVDTYSKKFPCLYNLMMRYKVLSDHSIEFMRDHYSYLDSMWAYIATYYSDIWQISFKFAKCESIDPLERFQFNGPLRFLDGRLILPYFFMAFLLYLNEKFPGNINLIESLNQYIQLLT